MTLKILVPILTNGALEQRKDVRYLYEANKLKEIEAKHVPFTSDLLLSNPENFYLFHQNDFVVVYDIVHNIPVKILGKLIIISFMIFIFLKQRFDRKMAIHC